MVGKEENLPARSDLEAAFDAAIQAVNHAIDNEMQSMSGEPAKPQLLSLIDQLQVEREKAVERGRVDPEWFQTIVRWIVEWAPESDLTLIAALGRIVRVSPEQLDK